MWHKRRWRCHEPACSRKSFTEAIAEIPPRARTTGRLRRAIAAAVGDACRSVAEVADSFGVSWPTAHKAVVAAAEAAGGEPEPTAVLGIDETRRGRVRWRFGYASIRGTPASLTLPVIRGLGRSKVVPAAAWWLGLRPALRPSAKPSVTWRSTPPRRTRTPSPVCARMAPGCCPTPLSWSITFHLVKLANDALSKVRRRVTWQQQGRRGRKVDPAWANRRRLLCARERLSEKAFAAMWNALIDADPSAQILTAWIAKEELRALLALARTGAHRDQLRHRLDVFYRWCAAADIDELHTLAATVETWWPAIEAFLSTGTTNARTEGVNRLVKQVKRSACGFRNTANSHRRIRFHCTHTQRAATATSTALPAQN